ncbi:MAG: NAD(P)-dependent oxidoreductase [Bacteroidetes bacterium]|nr:NAD(P)-dependent oxidoreductase [Bacteroidota bacterium]
MKRILITGSNGLLGQKLIHAYVKRKDVEVIATSLGANRMHLTSGYTYESLDITNKLKVEAIIKKYQPDTVINTAAMTNVDACETKREECWAINVTAVQNIVDVLTQYKPDSQLIHLSTDFIFDGNKGSEYVETDIPNPLSYYAQSKFESEKILQKSSINWAIARTIIVYGIADNMSRSNIVLWAKDALTKGQKINVVDDQFRSPTLAEDLAAGCILIADKKATGIYHLSGPKTMSILELVYSVANFWKLDKALITPSKSDNLNQAAKRPPRTGFDISKARKDLGYGPHTFEEGLKVLDEQL